MSVVGVHNCIVLVRYYLKSSSLEFESTCALWLIKGINLTQTPACLLPTTNFSLCMKYMFECILMGNTIIYILFGIIMIITFIFHIIYNFRNRNMVEEIYGEPEGLTDDQVNRLPKLNYTSTNNNTECAVCLDNFKEYEECVMIPTCLHLFHYECIKKWLNDKRTCPNCRCDIKLLV